MKTGWKVKKEKGEGKEKGRKEECGRERDMKEEWE